jgi:hypothetical protein
MGQQMKIFKDKDHNVINIGEWDYKKEMVQIGEEQRTDKKGNPLFEDKHNQEGELISHIAIIDPILEEQTFNPLPEGAYEGDEEIETFEDGSRIAKFDYKANRIREYPTVQEQLDAMYHDRVNNTDDWFNSIAAIKNKHPKV